MPSLPFGVSDFIAEDTPRGLFPLDSLSLYAVYGSKELDSYIATAVLDESVKTSAFLTAPICYAMKDSVHLRKVLGLDPISSFFLYKFVHDHAKDHFQCPKPGNRQRYGYAFKNRQPLSPTEQYHDFRRRSYVLKAQYRHYAKVDIGNCFNSFYHHDIDQFIESQISQTASKQIGQFLREINGGTSVNCFPQGTYPSKAIGNLFLSFIEGNASLRCPAIIRFLDDIFLFANEESLLHDDLYQLQKSIGTHHMALNPQKTQLGAQDYHTKPIEAVKRNLLAKREAARPYGDNSVDDSEYSLEAEERDYLDQIISQEIVAEEDLELALALIDKPQTAMTVLRLVFSQHQHLVKHAYQLLTKVHLDLNEVWTILRPAIDSNGTPEYALFWLAKIVSDFYTFDSDTASALMQIHLHKNATPFVKAAVLENPHNEHGFLELKDNQIRSSPGDIVGASALMGIRNLPKGRRNQIGKYAARHGQHMKVLADIVSKIEPNT